MNHWQVDLANQKVRHINGTEITFSGHPDSNNFDGHPSNIPSGLSAIEQVSLIRTGFEAYREAFEQKAPTKPVEKPAPVYSTVNKDRPVLKLKSRQ
jgi:hypothetical protein